MPAIIDKTDLLPWHKSRKWGNRRLSNIQKIIIHQELGEGSIEAVNEYHIAPNHISSRGCPHFCYHYGIRKNGEIIQANKLTHTTWHCKGLNSKSIGIMLVGNFDGPGYDLGTSEPTRAQTVALKELVDYLVDKFDLTAQDIYGHYHFGKPACPGYELQKWVEDYRKPVKPNGKDTVDRTVEEVQRRLNQLGYPAGPIDGILGIKTLTSIRKFQADHGLLVDGIVGPNTWGKLLEVC